MGYENNLLGFENENQWDGRKPSSDIRDKTVLFCLSTEVTKGKWAQEPQLQIKYYVSEHIQVL